MGEEGGGGTKFFKGGSFISAGKRGTKFFKGGSFISAGKRGAKFFKGRLIFSENIGPPGPFFSEIFSPGDCFWMEQLLRDSTLSAMPFAKTASLNKPGHFHAQLQIHVEEMLTVRLKGRIYTYPNSHIL